MRMRLLSLILLAIPTPALETWATDETPVKIVCVADSQDAFQAAAVDAERLYAISNKRITSLDRTTRKAIQEWEAANDSLVKHLNSGVVFNGQLLCANSNWPKVPLINTIEIFDAVTLSPVEQKMFPEQEAAINWIDRYDNSWWIAFAYYGDQVHKTYLVRYDNDWNELGKWTFPKIVTDRFSPHSNSGGSFRSNGDLYLTGHDHKEAYIVRVPVESKVLEYRKTVPIAMEGQGIAWDRQNSNHLYGISRKKRQIIGIEIVPELDK